MNSGGISPLCDEEAAALIAGLPAKPAIVVIGSTSFWHPESASTCFAIGESLAAIKDLVLITGGMTGIGEGVGRSFFETRMKEACDPDVFHVLPHGCSCWDYGVTLFAGSNMAERREVLGRLSRLYLAIEGGPGSVHEGKVALRNGAVVIPVGRSGGYAGELYPAVRCPAFASEEDWQVLGSSDATPERITEAVYEIVAAFLDLQNARARTSRKGIE
jgi:hypothetical protein